jgi:hypothetical protein
MPRIRTIKPEFPQSESIGSLSREARLLFLQLFTIVDDAGRARAAPRMLASLLYPYDDDAPRLIDGWLAEIAGAGLLTRYEAFGAHYLEITGWLKHQKIDRPTPSRLPPAPREDKEPREETDAREEASTPREASRGLAAESGSVSGSGIGITDHAPALPAVRAPSFEDFWRAFPRRDGPNPRRPAERQFHALVAAGVDPAMLIAAARRFAAAEAAKHTVGTRFVPQAMTWLAQERFADHVVDSAAGARTLDIAEAVKLFARTGHWSKWAGPEPGLGGCRAPPELLAQYGLRPDGRKHDPKKWEPVFGSDHAPTKNAPISHTPSQPIPPTESETP